MDAQIRDSVLQVNSHTAFDRHHVTSSMWHPGTVPKSLLDKGTTCWKHGWAGKMQNARCGMQDHQNLRSDSQGSVSSKLLHIRYSSPKSIFVINAQDKMRRRHQTRSCAKKSRTSGDAQASECRQVNVKRMWCGWKKDRAAPSCWIRVLGARVNRHDVPR